MNQYPREAWRPVLEGNFPAFEQEWERPVRVWDLVEGLRLHLHHHIVSTETRKPRVKSSRIHASVAALEVKNILNLKSKPKMRKNDLLNFKKL
jgi:hypothetical protein